MTKHLRMTSALVSGGMVAARAEAPTDVKTLITNLNKDFEEFKSSHETQAKQLAKGEIDPIKNELEAKLDKINASMDKAMETINSQAETLAHLELGDAPKDGVSPQEQAYGKAFDTFFREGDEATVKAAIAAGDIRAALSVGSDEDGGYTTPVEWDRTITSALKQVSMMRQYSQVQNVTGRGFRRLFNIRGTASGWVGETTGRPATASPQLQPYDYAFGEIYAQPAATQRILDDSEIDIAGWLGDEVALEFAYQESSAFVTGDGVNKPKGLMNFSATAEAALPAVQRHPLGGIGEVNSGAAVNLTTDGLIDLVYALPSERAISGSFYMNRTTQGVIRKMTDGDGNYIWQPPFQQGEPATLLGHSQRELLGMPDIAADALPVAYGDMSMTYSIFDRMGIRLLRDPYTSKPNVLFYSTKRVGGGLWNPEYMKFQKIAA